MAVREMKTTVSLGFICEALDSMTALTNAKVLIEAKDRDALADKIKARYQDNDKIKLLPVDPLDLDRYALSDALVKTFEEPGVHVFITSNVKELTRPLTKGSYNGFWLRFVNMDYDGE